MINIDECEESLKEVFKQTEKIAEINQEKVLSAFQKNRISTQHFAGTTGYGYSDLGRDTLNKLYADVFGAEDALVTPLITCGSHAIAIVLFGLLRPNDEMVAITGKPYDTLDDTIMGKTGKDIGSLKDMNVKYTQIELKDNKLDYDEIKRVVSEKKPKMVYLQRSRGYAWRKPLSIDEIEEACKFVKSISPESYFVVDNCYGEFVEEKEPTAVGADIAVGSLIKNAGGGICPTGGYIVGKKEPIEKISARLISPSLNFEVGSFEFGYRLFYQGLFMAPHTTCQAIKGAYLIGEVMNRLGYDVLPKSNEKAYDIIKSIKFNTEEELISFVQEIQKNSPVDSHVIPFPWDMSGYNSKVIMAAGTFVQGASIELSCDSPIRAPYIGYMQGGLTYEHVKIVAKNLLKKFA